MKMDWLQENHYSFPLKCIAWQFLVYYRHSGGFASFLLHKISLCGKSTQPKRLQGSLKCHISRKKGGAQDAKENRKIRQREKRSQDKKEEELLGIPTHEKQVSVFFFLSPDEFSSVLNEIKNNRNETNKT